MPEAPALLNLLNVTRVDCGGVGTSAVLGKPDQQTLLTIVSIKARHLLPLDKHRLLRGLAHARGKGLGVPFLAADVGFFGGDVAYENDSIASATGLVRGILLSVDAPEKRSAPRRILA